MLGSAGQDDPQQSVGVAGGLMEGYKRGWSHISLPYVDIDSSHYSFCLFLLKDLG